MSAAAKKSRWWSIAIVILAYGFCAFWVFTRSAPLLSDRPVTIRIAHWQIERGPPDGLAAVIKRYEELNPRVHVVQTSMPGRIYGQWLRAKLTGDEGTDLIQWAANLAGQRDIPARYFEPLTAALNQPNPYNRGTSQEKIPWVRTFNDELAGPKRDSPDPGQIYAISVSSGCVRLFCNVGLLKKITGSDRAPETFDDLRKIFAEVKDYARLHREPISGLAGSRDNGLWIVDAVIGTPMMGMVGKLDDSGYRYLYKWQSLAAYLEGRWTYHEPQIEAGIELVREVTQTMRPGFMQLRRDDATLEFFSGHAVFIYTGSWDATTLRREAPFKVVPMPVPQPTRDDPRVGKFVIGPGGEGRGETSFNFYLNKRSAHQAEALDFLRFLGSVPGNQLFTDNSLWLPAVNGTKVPEEIKSFQDHVQGYAFGQAGFQGIGSEQMSAWALNFYHLASEQGSVTDFVTALEPAMPKAIRADLETEYRNTLLLVRPQDGLIVARTHLATAAPQHDAMIHQSRREAAEMGQTMSEGLALQMNDVLEKTTLGR